MPVMFTGLSGNIFSYLRQSRDPVPNRPLDWPWRRPSSEDRIAAPGGSLKVSSAEATSNLPAPLPRSNRAPVILMSSTISVPSPRSQGFAGGEVQTFAKRGRVTACRESGGLQDFLAVLCVNPWAPSGPRQSGGPTLIGMDLIVLRPHSTSVLPSLSFRQDT